MTPNRLSLKQRFRLSRFIRGEEPSPGPISLDQRRIFILPTRRGLGFVLSIVLVLLIAFVYNNNLAYLLGFLLASIFFVTILHSYKSLAGLIIRADHNPPVFAGTPAGFNVSIQNPGTQPRFALEISLRETQIIDLAPGQSETLLLYADLGRRGWQPCGTVKISSCYPLGLFRAWSPLRFDSQVLVYPKPASIAAPFPETNGDDAQPGRNRRDGDEFFGLKQYQSGDSIRQIHWKSFAKGQSLQSKQYAGVTSTELWLNFHSAPGNDIEDRLGHLCRWIIEAEQAHRRYGLILPDRKFAPNCGSEHYRQCLQALALF